MDAAVVRNTASAIDAHAGDLDRVIGSVDGLAAEIAANWFGEAADEFHASWAHRHRPALSGLAGALHDYARTARTNADSQDRASAASTASLGAVSVGGAVTSGAGRSGGGTVFGLPPSTVANLALLALPGSLGAVMLAGQAINSAQDYLNSRVEGLGDLPMDAAGMFTGDVQGYVSVDAHAERAIDDLVNGSYDKLGGDAVSLGEDGAGLLWGGTAGRLISAYNTGHDIGLMITQIPAVHRGMDQFENGVVAYGQTQGGDIGTRYDGFSGFGNFVHDSAATAADSAAGAVGDVATGTARGAENALHDVGSFLGL